jgi:glycosyltransferase involved in cell wall biosynthesis
MESASGDAEEFATCVLSEPNGRQLLFAEPWQGTITCSSNQGRLLNEPIANRPRMLIVWSWLPCKHTGAGILMRRLFSGYPQDRLWALTSTQSKRATAPYDSVPSQEHQVSVPEIQIPRRWIHKLALLLNRLLIPWIVWRGVQLTRKEEVEAIFTVPWDHFTISAYLIHAITRRPLYMYIMDDPAGTRRIGGLQPLLYALLMPRVVRSARRLWGVSQGVCKYFERTYGVSCLPLLPLLDLEAFQKKGVGRADRGDGSLHIVFTGAIYSAQVDALRRLIRVIDQHNGNSKDIIRLTLYTSSSAIALKKAALVGNNVRRDEVPQEDVARVLAEADVAFLPLSFEPEMRHVVETSLPSKIAEYLAAGLPILAHAPSSSTVARYCREHGCGLVVDEPDDSALRDALLQLRNDLTLRRELSAKALEAAKENHDASRIAPAFLEQMSLHNSIARAG